MHFALFFINYARSRCMHLELYLYYSRNIYDLSVKQGAVRDLILIILGKYKTRNQRLYRMPVRGY
jgi:hypothetical protein